MYIITYLLPQTFRKVKRVCQELFSNFAQVRLTKSRISLSLRTQTYFRPLACLGRKITRASIEFNKCLISSASRFFLRNVLQTVSKRGATMTVSFFLEDRKTMMPTMDSRSRHLAFCIREMKNINFCDVSFENAKELRKMNSRGL